MRVVVFLVFIAAILCCLDVYAYIAVILAFVARLLVDVASHRDFDAGAAYVP
jgi:hypothetical protein